MTKQTEKNSTQILNDKFHYIFLSMDRAQNKTKNNWTKCRPFQERMFHSTVWFNQTKHCRRDVPISNRDHQHGIYFLNQMLPMSHSQLHQCQCTVAILPSGTQTGIEMVWHSLAQEMNREAVPIWGHHQRSLEQDTWPFKRPSWEKCFPLPLEKIFSRTSKLSAHRSLLWMSRARSDF